MNTQNNQSTSRVIFFQVNTNSLKIEKLCQTLQSHFEKKDPVMIFVEDENAQKYVDELLWKHPKESFLPHLISDSLTKDLIVISKGKTNLNGAKTAFNLCSTPLLTDGSFKIIYDFEDLTHPNKNRLSSIRFDAYKKLHFMIESRL